MPGASDEKNICSFWLVGMANKNGDWTTVETVSPRVTVTWEVDAGGEAAQEDIIVGNQEIPDSGEPGKLEDIFDETEIVPKDPDTPHGSSDISSTEPHRLSNIEG